MNQRTLRHCDDCGTLFLPLSRWEFFCPACSGTEVERIDLRNAGLMPSVLELAIDAEAVQEARS